MPNEQKSVKTIETEILIIGGGPAGLTAALYSARAGKRTVVIEGKSASRMSIGYEIENYPGFISIDSRELQHKFRDHALHFGAEIIEGEVLDFNLAFHPKMATTRDSLIQAGAVILASGKPMPKGKMIPGEENLIGLGLSYCSTCDGPLYRGRKIAAVGSSEEAVEDILSLAQIGCDVVWITEKNEDFRLGNKTLRELSEDKLALFPNTVIERIVGDKKLEKLILVRDGANEELEVEGIFVFRDVPTAPLFVKAGLELDHRQCLKTDRTQSTNIEGVFAAGDLTCGGMQVVSAAGEGCVAALHAISFLRSRENEIS